MATNNLSNLAHTRTEVGRLFVLCQRDFYLLCKTLNCFFLVQAILVGVNYHYQGHICCVVRRTKLPLKLDIIDGTDHNGPTDHQNCSKQVRHRIEILCKHLFSMKQRNKLMICHHETWVPLNRSINNSPLEPFDCCYFAVL